MLWLDSTKCKLSIPFSSLHFLLFHFQVQKLLHPPSPINIIFSKLYLSPVKIQVDLNHLMAVIIIDFYINAKLKMFVSEYKESLISSTSKTISILIIDKSITLNLQIIGILDICQKYVVNLSRKFFLFLVYVYYVPSRKLFWREQTLASFDWQLPRTTYSSNIGWS